MFSFPPQEELRETPKLGGGPLGFGDPDDRKLRKVERTIIIPKLIREEAEKKCGETLSKFLDCFRKEKLLAVVKCKEANDANNQCILSYAKNPDFVNEVTNKYLESRRHYRLTGEPLEKYQRVKRAH